jgi:hypothetical protein
MARRGGVKRISAMIYDDARQALKERLTMVHLPTPTYLKNILLTWDMVDYSGLRYLCRVPEGEDHYCQRREFFTFPLWLVQLG